MMEEKKILSVEHLSKVFPIHRTVWSRKKQNIQAVDDVSFSVIKGEVLGIVGESGSGKSTIARMLLGLEKPTKGNVIYHIPQSCKSEPPDESGAGCHGADFSKPSCCRPAGSTTQSGGTDGEGGAFKDDV